jgi:hypothetical protein
VNTEQVYREPARSARLCDPLYTTLILEASSSSVGTMSGQVVIQGFTNRQIPLFLRRLVTMLPALVVLAVGLNPSCSLVIGQVVLSFGIPFALISLLIHCRNRDIMGTLVNRRLTTGIAAVVVSTRGSRPRRQRSTAGLTTSSTIPKPQMGSRRSSSSWRASWSSSPR